MDSYSVRHMELLKFLTKVEIKKIITFCRSQRLCDVRHVLSRLVLGRDGRHERTGEGVERGHTARGVVIRGVRSRGTGLHIYMAVLSFAIYIHLLEHNISLPYSRMIHSNCSYRHSAYEIPTLINVI